MLIAQGPLRISLFGGGSDLPAFLANNDGAVLSMAIDRCVYIAGHPFTHRDGILLKYSKTEDVPSPDALQHPIAREVLGRYNINNVDLAVMADVPAGTGLGSSSAFTVAFLSLVRQLKGLPSTPVDLAREACEIEIDVLREPIGYQDQWASALGGINVLRFSASEVQVERAAVDASTVRSLENNLHLIAVGSVGRDEGRQHNETSVLKKPAHLSNAADVLGAVLWRKAQIVVEPKADVVTVQHVARYASIDEGAFDRKCQRRLPRPGKAGEPHRAGAVPIQSRSILAADVAFGPHNVLAHGLVNHEETLDRQARR